MRLFVFRRLVSTSSTRGTGGAAVGTLAAIAAAMVAGALATSGCRDEPVIEVRFERQDLGPVPRGIVVLGIFGMVYAALTIALKHPDAVRSWQSLTAWRAS